MGQRLDVDAHSFEVTVKIFKFLLATTSKDESKIFSDSHPGPNKFDFLQFTHSTTLNLESFLNIVDLLNSKHSSLQISLVPVCSYSHNNPVENDPT